MIDGNTYAIDRYLDEREDYDARQEAQLLIEEQAERIDELEAAIIDALRERDEDMRPILRKALHGGGR
jgi:TATA-binding protein-associated factor Taf7